MNIIPEVLESLFTGEYHLKRKIHNLDLTIEGKATFQKKHKSVFLYHEEGQYSLNNTPISFHKENTFELTDAQLIIYNYAKKILHDIEISAAEQIPFVLKNTHKCNKDFYHLTFAVESPLKFTTEYLITGPQKNHNIVTQYFK